MRIALRATDVAQGRFISTFALACYDTPLQAGATGRIGYINRALIFSGYDCGQSQPLPRTSLEPVCGAVAAVIDARFNETRYRRLFPAWWKYLRVRHTEGLREAIGSFWKRYSRRSRIQYRGNGLQRISLQPVVYVDEGFFFAVAIWPVAAECRGGAGRPN